jgi:hypothetical protein
LEEELELEDGCGSEWDLTSAGMEEVEKEDEDGDEGDAEDG